MVRKSRPSGSDPLSKLRKDRADNPPYPIGNIWSHKSSSKGKNGSEEELGRLKTPTKKKPRGSSSKLRRSPRLKDTHLLQAGLDSSLSGRKMEKHTEALRAQNKRGEHRVKVPSGSKVRKTHSEINKTFWPDFETKTTKLCPDNGASVMCTDVTDFLLKVVHIRGKRPVDVAVVKFNLDGGRGSQKLMSHIIFFGDPILRNDATEEERTEYAQKHGRYKDTSVKRTLILGCMNGGGESHECTKFFYDKLVDKVALQKTFPKAEVFCPNDLKQSNKACGLGEHGSRHPLHTSLWSPWPVHSNPQQLRTGQSIIDDLRNKDNAKSEGKNSEPINFHSVKCEPVKVLKDEPDIPTVYIFCPCQLHLNLGMAVHFVEAVERLDPEVCREWEDELGVTRDEKHGSARTSWCTVKKLALLN